jgi:hypothetical protein
VFVYLIHINLPPQHTQHSIITSQVSINLSWTQSN